MLISGYVQGVGYRKFVRHTATKLGLFGWVRNLPDGKVEAEVVGDEGRIQKFIEECQRGPMLSEVGNVEVQWMEKEFPFADFVILH